MIAAAIGFALALALAIPACRAARRFAERREILDHPNRRSSHTRPTPRGGGMGILAAWLPAAVATVALGGALGDSARAVACTVAAVALLAGLGFRDDRQETGPAAKLVLQLLAAGLVVWGVGWVDSVPLPGRRMALHGLGLPLTVFWLVGFSNAYNFMDGIDGIAGLFGGVAAAGLAAAGLLAGPVVAVWVAAPLAGACLGFLRENWSPARVFMGDVGSLPIGFLLALTVVLGASGGGVPFVTGFLALGPFLFDTIFTLGRRIRRGENVLRAHRSHLYQRLVIAGWSHARVSVFYGGWTGLTAGLGIVYLDAGTVLRASVLGAAVLSGMGAWLLVVRAEGKRGKG